MADDKQHDEKAVLGSDSSEAEDIGVSKDGMRVHPQPSADPLDPLNWSSLKKHAILAIVMYMLVYQPEPSRHSTARMSMLSQMCRD